MEIKYPLIIAIVIFLLILIFVLPKNKKAASNQNGKKIANTSLIKKTDAYKKIARKYRIVAYTMLATLAASIICISVLSARIVTVQEINDKAYNRDIMLCMDVSTSMNMVNQKIVDAYDNIIDSMKKERFGLSIFNGMSLLRVPLTDDYDFVKEELETMWHIYDLIGYSEDIDTSKLSEDELREVQSYLFSGTLSKDRVSSATGNGLASCIYDFPDLDAERSRIIILSSDNETFGEQKIDVANAAKIAKNKNIKVYALAPEAGLSTTWGGKESGEKVRNELKRAVESTGGRLYIINDGNAVKEVINEIEKTETTLLDENRKTVETDQPELLYILATLFLIAAVVAMRIIK